MYRTILEQKKERERNDTYKIILNKKKNFFKKKVYLAMEN